MNHAVDPRTAFSSVPFQEFPAADVEGSIVARFERIAARYPERPAIETRSSAMTYRELDAAADALADALLARQGATEEPIAMLLGGTAFYVGILGVLKAGKFYVPLDPSFPEDRSRHILADSGARIVLADERHIDLARRMAPAACDALDAGALSSAAAAAPPRPSISADAPAYVIYTSGSTGKPKGVLQNHRNVLHNCMYQTNTYRLTERDRLSQLHSNCVMGNVRATYNALLNGAALYPFDVKAEGLAMLGDWMLEAGITIYHSTSSLFRHFGMSLPGGRVFPDVRLVIVGGEAATAADFELFKQGFPPGCLFCTGLGSTETCTVRMLLLDHDSAPATDNGVLPLGYPVDGIDIGIVDENGAEVQAGEVGEIMVASRYLAPGYWRDPELTAARFHPASPGDDPARRRYRMGDMGKVLPDGCLAHAGRKDTQVKVRGFRVELGEVEAALGAHPEVQACAVAAPDGPTGERRLVACVVKSPRSRLTADALRESMRKGLPDYMLPSVVRFVDALPLTPSGKVDRMAIPAVDGDEPAAETAAPHDELEAGLAEIFGAELQRRPLGVHTDFFEAGLDSLMAVRLVTRVERELGRPLPLNILFEAPTIAQLAARLRNHVGQDAASAVVPINPEGTRPPLVCLPGTGGVASFAFRTLAKYVGDDQPFYAVQLQGLSGDRFVHRTVEEMAADRINVVLGAGLEAPYRLLGYSFGGRLVFEMAHQLRARGHEVAFVGLVDSWAPGYPEIAPRHARYRMHLRNLARMTGRRRLQYLGQRAHNVRKRIRRVAELLNRRHMQEASTFEERVTQFERETRRISRRYQPPVYPGDVVLFRATRRPSWVGASFQDPGNGWSAFIRGKLEVHDIASAHLEILSEPDVAGLGKALRECI